VEQKKWSMISEVNGWQWLLKMGNEWFGLVMVGKLAGIVVTKFLGIHFRKVCPSFRFYT